MVYLFFYSTLCLKIYQVFFKNTCFVWLNMLKQLIIMAHGGPDLNLEQYVRGYLNLYLCQIYVNFKIFYMRFTIKK